MIASLRGTLAAKDPDSITAVVEAGGVGYRVFLPSGTLAALPPVGEEVFLRVVTVVREDAFLLFGFGDEEERTLFNLLTGVKGIGPKLALAVLSGIRPGDLSAAIGRGDAARVATVPGIGKKTAERIILELKDKVPALPSGPAPASVSGLPPELENDVLSALVNLGYRAPDARAALTRVAEAQGEGSGRRPTLDSLLRECLKLLAQGRARG